jgi:hypothetical protein
MRQIVVFRCFDCHIKKIFEFDFDTLDDIENKIKSYQEFQYSHSLHVGFILTQKFNTEADKIKILRDIGSWFNLSGGSGANTSPVDTISPEPPKQ